MDIVDYKSFCRYRIEISGSLSDICQLVATEYKSARRCRNLLTS